MSRCCIITIGAELLQGRVIDTNASFLAKKLTVLGHSVVAKISVGDDHEAIGKALDFCIESMNADIIITTGGLGPTPDDVTMEAIAQYLGVELVMDSEALKEVESKYRERGLPLTEDRMKMAKIPRGAKPIPNPVGVAPGAWIETEIKDKKILIVVLPGVPKEMESMFERYVEKRLKVEGRVLIEATLILTNARESDLAPILKTIMKEFSEFYIKSHPLGHEVKAPCIKLYVATYSTDIDKGISRCVELIKRLTDLVKRSLPNVDIETESSCRTAM